MAPHICLIAAYLASVGFLSMSAGHASPIGRKELPPRAGPEPGQMSAQRAYAASHARGTASQDHQGNDCPAEAASNRTPACARKART
jgi:hypothetical protein